MVSQVPQILLTHVSPLLRNYGALGFLASMYLCNPARIVLGGISFSFFASNFDNKTYVPVATELISHLIDLYFPSNWVLQVIQ